MESLHSLISRRGKVVVKVEGGLVYDVSLRTVEGKVVPLDAEVEDFDVDGVDDEPILFDEIGRAHV